MKKFVFIILLFFLLGLSEPHYEAASSSLDFHINDLEWQKVDELLPRKSTFTVIDVETGKEFEVQRRAGNRHADVQPLSKEDTKIMKEIYGGHWSWKRRAVLVKWDDSLIAASMHGMPHGAGALQNGFPGHFCIHFSGSTTHKTGNPDPSHHIMILKAAGKLDQYIETRDAQALLDVFLVSVKNSDKGITKKLVISNLEEFDEQFHKTNQIESMKWEIETTEATKDDTDLSRTYRVKMKFYLKEIGPVKEELSFRLIRSSTLSPWKVEWQPLLLFLDQSMTDTGGD